MQLIELSSTEREISSRSRPGALFSTEHEERESSRESLLMGDSFWQLNAQALKRSERSGLFYLPHVFADRFREGRERVEGRLERKERSPIGIDERDKLCLRELPEELRGVLIERGRRREL